MACAPASPPPARSPPSEPIHVGPITDYVVAAGLEWMVVADLGQLRRSAPASEALRALLPREPLRRRAEAAGVDLASVRSLLVASYPLSTLVLVETRGGEVEVEQRFADGIAPGPIRSSPHERIRVVEGVVEGYPEALVSVDGLLVARSRGDPTPAKAAGLFAMGRLRRSPTALAGAGLARLPADVHRRPIRLYAPGPFPPPWDGAGGGLLAAVEAAAITLALDEAAAELDVVLVGHWEPADEARLLALWGHLASSQLGTLLGLSEPSAAPAADATPDVLRLRVRVPRRVFVTGLAGALLGELDADWGPGPEAPSDRELPVERD